MYVCICHALTDGDVRSAETGGAASHGEVFRHFGVTPCCGRCIPTMRGMLSASEPAGDRRHVTDATPAAPCPRRHER